MIIDISKIEWIEGRTYSDAFRFKSDPSKALRVSYYNQKLLEEVFEEIQRPKTKARDLIETDPIRIENKMALIVDALIQSGLVQPHYLQQIKNEDSVNVLARVAPLIPPARRAILLNARDKDLQKRYNNVQIFHRYSGNMSRFMLENKNNFHMKIVIFQVLYGLGILQMHVQGFKHGNLTPESVYIEKKRATMAAVEYAIPGTSRVYSVPDVLGFRARIGDFDLASGSDLKNYKADQQSKDDDVVNFLKNIKTTCPQTNAFIKRRNGNGNDVLEDVLRDPYFDVFLI